MLLLSLLPAVGHRCLNKNSLTLEFETWAHVQRRHYHRRRSQPVFELSVLPADVDGQTLPIVLERLLFTVFAHPLCVLGALHLHKTLKAHSQTLRHTAGSTSEHGLGLVAYLSQQPVGEVFADLAKGQCEVQDVLVGELAGGDPSDVDHLTGATLQDRNAPQSPKRAVVKPPDDLSGPGPAVFTWMVG